MAADPKSKTLPMPGNAIADPDFFADNPTASRGTPRDNGNLGFGDLQNPKPSDGPFKNLTDGK